MKKEKIYILIIMAFLLAILCISMLIKPNIKIVEESHNNPVQNNGNLPEEKENNTFDETNQERKPDENDKNLNQTGAKEKINIYLFWGDGCPHCENLIAFLDSISEEYTSLYTLHSFEVWHNAENKKLMKSFSNITNQNNTGVPFLIIGSETFIGYTPFKEESIKKAIKEEYSKENRVDYYKEINGN